MFDKLDDLLLRYEDIMNELNEPNVVSDQERFRKLMKEQSDLQPIVDAYKEYKKCKETVEESLMMLEEENDEEMREMLKEELNEAKARIEELEHTLKILLLPKDPNDDKNVIVEIRAGAGGDEAALFAAEIYRMQTAIDTVNRIIQENLTAVRIVKACVRGDYEVEKFEEGNQNLRQESETAFRLAALNMPAMQFVMYGTILAILLFGGYLIQKGSMKVGELTGFLSYVLQILNSLMMISNVFLLLTRSMASGARILEVIDEKVDLTDEKVRNIEVERGSVDFEHVWFKYKKEAKEYVLSDISFHIEAGQTVGVIGQTGAAKSTLVQLIPRLYDATEGVVKVDGVPVQEYPMAHLREAIAMVLQKNTLFSGSLLDNLRWGKEDASMEEIEEACRIACVDEVLERLPEGYETEMGQGGVNVSGGQKQRICIARALLKKPKILILDDSTSAVDTATEAKIRERMGAALPDMTKIIIGQRISSVRHADQIIILDDGRASSSS